MKFLDLDEVVGRECAARSYTLPDYEAEAPRWCKGCGDLSLLSAVQQMLRDNQVPPETVVCVSGIGCSSRFPHYLNTYGFHGIHGRALPISTGIVLARPDLHVMTVMGDGDCFSIGAGHWLHAIRYNPNLLVLVLDNEIYALTKKQVSPTTPSGTATSTTPRGAYLEALNPLSVVLGITNVSFVAQTTSWLAKHLEATLNAAWNHRGLSFVRILQRCPAFMPTGLGNGGQNLPVVFLEHSQGIPVHKGFMKDAPVAQHDWADLHRARQIATTVNPQPLGLLYWNSSVPAYDRIRHSQLQPVDRRERVERLNVKLDQFAVEANGREQS